MISCCPCDECEDKSKREVGACNNGFGICKKYMDYIEECANEARQIVSLRPDTPYQIAIYNAIMKGE